MSEDCGYDWKETLEEDIKRMLQNIPEYAGMLQMYRELLEAQHETKLKLEAVEPGMDKNKVAVCTQAGVVLLRELQPEMDIEPVRELFHQLKNIAANHGSEYVGEAQKIDEAIEDGILDIDSVLRESFLGGSIEEMKKSAIDLDLDPHFFALLVSFAVRPNLELYAEKLLELFNEDDWEKPFCPVCGRLPNMARLETKEGKRVLCCSACSATWRFPRLKCVNCGIEDHEKLRILFTEETTRKYFADVCDNCKRYLKCVDTREMARMPVMQVVDVGTLHIDMLAQREGFVTL